MKYFITTGSWPLREQPYHNLMKKVGLERGTEKDSEVLFLPGGADLGMRQGRDAEEFALWAKWVREDKPIIGICRGMQLMMYLTGNNLIEDIPSESKEIIHTTFNGLWTGQSSFHATELGIIVNSRHHQGFRTANEYWTIVDKSSDGIIEAVKNKNQFGVQWHPEHPEMNGTPAQEWWIKTVKTFLNGKDI